MEVCERVPVVTLVSATLLSKLFVCFVQYDQAELAEDEKRLHILSQSGQHEAAMAEKVDTALRSGKSVVEDLQIVGNDMDILAHCLGISLTTSTFVS